MKTYVHARLDRGDRARLDELKQVTAAHRRQRAGRRARQARLRDVLLAVSFHGLER